MSLGSCILVFTQPQPAVPWVLLLALAHLSGGMLVVLVMAFREAFCVVSKRSDSKVLNNYRAMVFTPSHVVIKKNLTYLNSLGRSIYRHRCLCMVLLAAVAQAHSSTEYPSSFCIDYPVLHTF